ncbi:PREDICTED: leucine-rich repeat receptor protein kinase EMS1-like [Nelumbo nucifera]|uniref:Leucine-rich repeat receptor protein kinase EMS1-like n=1 Tax=Nelumbo nucifera TaxID=4432 RepID=A0A1U8AZG6_NELNU|nr:PREDICTED: leucine-rich repeat receptor protein kinase EMS1-like [Nelumbo nucifera]
MNSTFQAALAATASFFLVTLFFAIVIAICKATKRSDPRTRDRAVPNVNQPLSSIAIDESASFDPYLSRISMNELVIATRNFASDGIIGDGSFGLVYKARLSDNVTVAVKKLSKDAFQGFREFRAEMETLGKIRHPNLVKILGYCVAGDDRILIYEFIEKGCLDQWLHDTSSSQEAGPWSSSVVRAPLSWETRIKIIRGVANGLHFLHTLDTPIIHRDIKASNVLLDSEFEAHIADFGLARKIEALNSHVSTQVAGTMGYMPPEYKDGVTVATVKADVYSFGILMVEIATGKRPSWPIKIEDEHNERKEYGLIEWARKRVAEERHLEILDPLMSKEGLRESEVGEFFRIACLCTSERSRDRSSMEEVVELLKQLTS